MAPLKVAGGLLPPSSCWFSAVHELCGLEQFLSLVGTCHGPHGACREDTWPSVTRVPSLKVVGVTLGAAAEVMVLNFVIDFICFLLQEQFSDLQKMQSILFLLSSCSSKEGPDQSVE